MGGGLPGPGGVCLIRGGLPGPGGVSQHALRQTPFPPPRGQTHACKKHDLGHNFVAAGNKS